MKKILIGLVLFIVVTVIGGLIYVSSNASSIIASQQPKIEEELSKSLGAKIRLGQIDVSVFPSLEAQTSGVQVGPDGASGFTMELLRAKLKLFPLLSGKAEIEDVTIQSPKITLVQDAGGVRLKGFPASAQNKSKPRKEKKQKTETGSSQDSSIPSVPISLELDSLNLVNASLHIEDSASGKTTSIDRLNLSLGASLLDNVLTLTNLDFSANALDNFDLSAQSDEIKVFLQNKKAEVPALQVNLIGTLATGSALKIGGPIALSASESSSKILSKLNFSLQEESGQIEIDASLENNKATLKKLLFTGFGGELNAQAKHSLKTGIFDFNASSSGINFEQVLAAAALKEKVPLTGILSELKVALSGTLGDTLKQSLAGTSSVLVKDGSLRGYNLGKVAFSALSDLPFVSDSIRESLPPEQKESLSDPNTVIKSFSANLLIGNGVAQIKESQLISALFDLSSKGSVAFTPSYDVSSSLFFNPVVSLTLAKAAKELESALDEKQRLEIPMSIKGSGSNIQVLPNTKRLLEITAKAVVKNKAKKALGDALKDKGVSVFGF
jgi:uncharacterized protein involved in outer membrane biogenesis